MSNTTKVFQRSNGLARVKVYERSDYYFSFCEESWREYENGSTGELYSYWIPTFEGGLYESFEEAEPDARARIPWLRVGS